MLIRRLLHCWPRAKPQLLEDVEYEKLGIKTKAQFYPQVWHFLDKTLPQLLWTVVLIWHSHLVKLPPTYLDRIMGHVILSTLQRVWWIHIHSAQMQNESILSYVRRKRFNWPNTSKNQQWKPSLRSWLETEFLLALPPLQASQNSQRTSLPKHRMSSSKKYSLLVLLPQRNVWEKQFEERRFILVRGPRVQSIIAMKSRWRELKGADNNAPTKTATGQSDSSLFIQSRTPVQRVVSPRVKVDLSTPVNPI